MLEAPKLIIADVEHFMERKFPGICCKVTVSPITVTVTVFIWNGDTDEVWRALRPWMPVNLNTVVRIA